MHYSGYSHQLNSQREPIIRHLAERLEYVESIGRKSELINPTIMLRQLGKWSQEFFQPRKWKDADKLIIQHDEPSGQIAVYFQSLLTPHLTITYTTDKSKIL